MKCRKCSSKQLIKKGFSKGVQRYLCKKCGKYQQKLYSYKLYNERDDKKIIQFNAESVGIRSMSRILGYSPSTILRRILILASKVKLPSYYQHNEIYEVDEMCTFVKKNKRSHYVWITYGINRRTRDVIAISVGRRTKKDIGKVIKIIRSYCPKKIITDKLNTYPKLVLPFLHDTNRYSNNRIERSNLTLRTHLKRLTRKTICFSKSKKMLEACILLYLDFIGWRLKM